MFKPQWAIFTFFSSCKKVQFICVQYLHGSNVLLSVQYTQLTDQAVHVHAQTTI